MRREFSKEFKRDAVSLVIEQGYSRVEAARSLGVHSTVLGRWVREYQTDEGDAFRGKGKLRPEQEEIRQLREEVKRLKMEKEILKKAAANSTGHCNTSFIAQHKKTWPVDVMCQLIGINRYSYYSYQHRQKKRP